MARSWRRPPSSAATTTRSSRWPRASTRPSTDSTPRRCGASSPSPGIARDRVSCSAPREPSMSERDKLPRARLEAVLLDAGGTLIRLDFEWMAETVSALGTRVSAAGLRRGEVEGRRRYDRSRGDGLGPGAPRPPIATSAEIREYFTGTLEAAGVPAPLITPALERLEGRNRETGLWTRPMEGAPAALDELAALGRARTVA